MSLAPSRSSLPLIHEGGGMKVRDASTAKVKERVSCMAVKNTLFSFRGAIIQPTASNSHASSA